MTPTRKGEGQTVLVTVARMGDDDTWQHNERAKITGLRNRLTAALVRFLPRTPVLALVRNLQSPL